MIAHISIWSKDIESLKDFYTTYFECKVQDLYFYKTMVFKSYFLYFQSGGKLELVPSDVSEREASTSFNNGFPHLAISMGSKIRLYQLYSRLLAAGARLVSPMSRKSCGMYEFVILDPEKNRISITN